MKFSQNIIGAICFTLLLGVCAFAQEQANPTKTISVCRFEILNPTGTFRLQFSYILDVDADGQITKVTELASTQNAKKMKFVREELLVECMKKWQLEPAGKYFVSFYGGTTSIGTSGKEPRDYMRIVDPNKQELIVELPMSYPNRDKNDEKPKGKQ